MQRSRAIDLVPLRRADPIEALELWRAFALGCWTLVARRVDDEGRCWIVARRDGAASPLRGLTEREREVTTRVAAGDSNKLVAYELGVSTGTVAVLLQRAFRKLGLTSRLELIAAAGAQALSATRPRGGAPV